MVEKISIFELMKSAFHLWKKHFVKIAVAGFIVYLPTQICIELVSSLIEETIPLDDIQSLRLVHIYNGIRYLIGSVALLGIINFVVKILNNEEEQTAGEIILHGLKKWPKFIGLGFLAGLKILGYTLLLIIPGIYKSVRLSFLDCVVATNNNIFTDELKESERLVENYWWKIFGFLLLMFLLSFLFELLFLPFVMLDPDSQILSLILGVTVQVFQTYFIVVRASYYFSIKELKNETVILNE